MGSSATPTTGEVLAAIERERAAWETLLAEVGEAHMLTPGPMGNWTFKDLVAHLTGWRARTLQRLEAAANGKPEPPPPWPAALQEDDEVDAINAWIQETNADLLLGEVIHDSRESYARLAEIVQMLPHDALRDPDAFPWLEGHSLGEAIVRGELFSHYYDEHEPQVRAWLAASQG